MRFVRSAALLALVCGCPRRGWRRVVGPGLLTLLSATSACSDPPPPIIGDLDASSGHNDVYIAPCSTPATGCPCPDAGALEVCGTVYHYAGSYVTCSKEYITCQDDGKWGPCVGALVYGAE